MLADWLKSLQDKCSLISCNLITELHTYAILLVRGNSYRAVQESKGNLPPQSADVAIQVLEEPPEHSHLPFVWSGCIAI